MTKEKLLKFMKSHKKEIIAAGLMTIGAVTLFVITKRKVDVPKFEPASALFVNKPDNWRAIEDKNIEALDWKLGKVTDLWPEGGWTNMIVKNVTPADLGKFGEEALKIDGVNSDTVIDTLICFATDAENLK